MTTDVRNFTARLLAGLCVEAAREPGRIGALAENMPALDAAGFVRAVAEGRPGARVAVLGDAKARLPALKAVTVTTDPAEANKWRNDADAKRGVPLFVLALGQTAKLNSLRTALQLVGAADLRRAAVRQAIDALRAPEREVLWRLLASHTGEIPTAKLLDLAAAIEGAPRGKLVDREAANLYRVGLVPSDSLLGAKGQAAAEKALRKTFDTLERLRDLKTEDRDRLARMLKEGGGQEKDLAKQVLRYASSHKDEDLEGLTEEGVREALRWSSRGSRTEKGGDDDSDEAEPKRPSQRDSDELAAELLLRGDIRELQSVARQLHEANDDDDGEPQRVKVGRERVHIRPKPGLRQSLSAFDRLITADTWGGLISVEAEDTVAALKRINDDECQIEPFRPSAERGVEETLSLTIELGYVTKEVLLRWARYADLRAGLLPHKNDLAKDPLIALSDVEIAGQVESTLAAYGDALAAVNEAAQALTAHGSLDRARRLIGQVLAVDVVYIRMDNGFSAIIAPVHPFHLWRYSMLASVLRNHPDEIRAIAKDSSNKDAISELLGELPPVSPNIVLSNFAVDTPLDRAIALIPVGVLGSSVEFAEPTTRQLGRFRGKALSQVCERLLRLMPHAGFGLRVALVDPPPLATVLEDLIRSRGVLGEPSPLPLHVTVYRTRRPVELSDEEGEALDDCAQALNHDGGSFEIERQMPLAQIKDHLKEHPAHIAVVFDPGEGLSRPVIVLTPPPLSPLATSHVYRYDPIDDHFDVVIAGDSSHFRLYHDLFCQLLDVPRTNFLGRRSGASNKVGALAEIAESAMWTVIADQGIERTINLAGARRIDWRSEAGRDLVTFTRYPETVEDLVRDAVRLAGLPVDEETVKRTLGQLFELSGETVLNLAKARPDVARVDAKMAKGVIGVLAAVRWYSATYPEALIISLDDAKNHRWILGHQPDDRHGDLVAVRPSDKGIIVEGIEVKAHDDEEAGTREVSGIIEGKAVIQVEQTLRVLRDLMSPTMTSPVAKARAAVLRDQLYRAVAARPYDRPRRQHLVNLLEELFDKGPASFSGMIFKVRVDASAPSSSGPSQARMVKGPGGERIGIVDLVERGATVRTTTPSPPSTPLKSPIGGVSPPPQSAGGPAANHAPASAREGRLRVLIGEMPTGGAVYWDPHDPEQALNNFGLHITGDSGAGKTQTLRAIIAAVCARGLPVCIFDFKNDYAKEEFSRPLGLTVYDVARAGLPFNPLSLVADERGEVYPVLQVHEVAGILRRVFQLGDQQEARLKEAIKGVYTAHGFGLERQPARSPSARREAPTFDDVRAALETSGKNELLLNRLSPLFDLHLFPSDRNATTTFEQMLQAQVVLDLHELPDERIKAAIAEFIIARLHVHVLRGEQPRELRRLLVFDEAWRVAQSARLQELAREGRAFGVGIALGTQFPGDIPETLAGNLATQLFLQNQDADHCKSIVRALTGATAGPQARQITQRVGRLQKFEGFFRNQQFSPFVLVKVLPHHLRGEIAADAS